MEEQVRQYFEELDPEKRKALLEEIDKDKASFRRELYKKRFEFRRKPDRIADLWLFKCVYLPGLYRRKFLKKATLREVNLTIDEFFLREQLNDKQREELYLEMRNAVRRYLSTCKSAKYASSFFGLKKASDDEKFQRTTEDIWKMSRGIARVYGLEKELALWCDACYAELIAYEPSCEARFQELEKDFKK